MNHAAPRIVEIERRDVAFQGYFRVDRYVLRHGLFAGGLSKPIQREVFERGHAAGVVLYDPDRDAVVLIDQFRIGAHCAGGPAWVTELVAGIIEPGEDPAAVAARESEEEAGCAVLELLPIARYIVTPGCSSETVRLYCGRVDSRGIGGIHGLDHEDEDIRARVVPLDQALDEVLSAPLPSSLTLLGLMWLKLNREMLRARWRVAA
jgi:ADP-ribose pyrophosphatase